MPEPHEANNYDGSIELAFDVAKASGQIKFLGLLNRDEESANTMTGLFDWTCQVCGAVSQDTVVIKPQEGFLAKWSCRNCSRVTLVRFRARATAEWIAQHTLAITGKAFLAPAEGGGQPTARARNAQKHPRKSVARSYVWLAIPVLAVIIVMGVLDLRRVSPSSASLPSSGRECSQATPSKRLVGCWVNRAGDHVVYFSPVDPVSRKGTYTLVSRSDKRAHTVQFKIVQEEAESEQLVIREESGGLSNGSEVSVDPDFVPSEVTLYVPVHNRSMTRMEIHDGEPVMTMYHNADVFDAR